LLSTGHILGEQSSIGMDLIMARRVHHPHLAWGSEKGYNELIAHEGRAHKRKEAFLRACFSIAGTTIL